MTNRLIARLLVDVQKTTHGCAPALKAAGPPKAGRGGMGTGRLFFHQIGGWHADERREAIYECAA
jgi:hypothetical protein